MTTVLIVSLLCLAVCGALGQKLPNTESFAQECLQELNVELESSDLEDLKGNECPTSENAKKIMGCTLRKMEVMKEGKFDPEGMMKILDSAGAPLEAKDAVKSIMDECNINNEQNEEEVAVDICKCFAKSEMFKVETSKKK